MTLLGGLALIEFTRLLLPSCFPDLANEKGHLLLGKCGWFAGVDTSTDVDQGV